MTQRAHKLAHEVLDKTPAVSLRLSGLVLHDQLEGKEKEPVDFRMIYNCGTYTCIYIETQLQENAAIHGSDLRMRHFYRALQMTLTKFKEIHQIGI